MYWQKADFSSRFRPAWVIIYFSPPARAGAISFGEATIAEQPEYLVVLNTCPDSETAGRIAADLVAGKLAACVQVLPGLQSYFHWQGKVDCEEEYLLLIKTSSASYPALEQRIRELHPYELPEIIGVPVNKGLPEYLSWIDECTHKDA